MNRAMSESQARLIAEQKETRRKAREFKYHQADMRANDGGSNEFGRFVTAKRQNSSRLGESLTSAYEKMLASAFVATALEKITAAITAIGAMVVSLRSEAEKRGYIVADNPLDPRLPVEVSDMAVPASVAAHLARSEKFALEQRNAIGDIFAQRGGEYGPHPEQIGHYKQLFNIENADVMRFDHDMGEYAFCINHVCGLSERAVRLGETDTGMARVFGVTADANGSRKLKVGINVEETATANDLKVAEKAAQVRVAPPHLKMR